MIWVFAHMTRESFEDARVAQPHHQEIGPGDHALNVLAHERPNVVWDMLLDKPSVCSWTCCW